MFWFLGDYLGINAHQWNVISKKESIPSFFNFGGYGKRGQNKEKRQKTETAKSISTVLFFTACKAHVIKTDDNKMTAPLTKVLLHHKHNATFVLNPNVRCKDGLFYIRRAKIQVVLKT